MSLHIAPSLTLYFNHLPRSDVGILVLSALLDGVETGLGESWECTLTKEIPWGMLHFYEEYEAGWPPTARITRSLQPATGGGWELYVKRVDVVPTDGAQ